MVFTKLYLTKNIFSSSVAQSAGFVEYTDCKRVRPNKYPEYKIKSSDGEVLALEILGMGSTPSFPLLPGLLLLGVVAPDRVLSMGQIEKKMLANK